MSESEYQTDNRPSRNNIERDAYAEDAARRADPNAAISFEPQYSAEGAYGYDESGYGYGYGSASDDAAQTAYRSYDAPRQNAETRSPYESYDAYAARDAYDTYESAWDAAATDVPPMSANPGTTQASFSSGAAQEGDSPAQDFDSPYDAAGFAQPERMGAGAAAGAAVSASTADTARPSSAQTAEGTEAQARRSSASGRSARPSVRSGAAGRTATGRVRSSSAGERSSRTSASGRSSRTSTSDRASSRRDAASRTRAAEDEGRRSGGFRPVRTSVSGGAPRGARREDEPTSESAQSSPLDTAKSAIEGVNLPPVVQDKLDILPGSEWVKRVASIVVLIIALVLLLNLVTCAASAIGGAVSGKPASDANAPAATTSNEAASASAAAASGEAQAAGVESPWTDDGRFSTGDSTLDTYIKELCDEHSTTGGTFDSNAYDTNIYVSRTDYVERANNQSPWGPTWDIEYAKQYFQEGNSGNCYNYAAVTEYVLKYFGYSDAEAEPCVVALESGAWGDHGLVFVTNKVDGKRCIIDDALSANGWMLDIDSYQYDIRNIGQNSTIQGNVDVLYDNDTPTPIPAGELTENSEASADAENADTTDESAEEDGTGTEEGYDETEEPYYTEEEGYVEEEGYTEEDGGYYEEETYDEGGYEETDETYYEEGDGSDYVEGEDETYYEEEA